MTKTSTTTHGELFQTLLARAALVASVILSSAFSGCDDGTSKPCSGAACGTADAGEADGGAACVDGGCPTTCATMRADGTCPVGRICETTPDGPICQQACELADQGFDPATGTCRSCTEISCSPPKTCQDGVAGSIATQCATDHRTCTGAVGEAACGDCLPSYLPNGPDGACVPDNVCGGVTCTDQQIAVPLAGGGCECRQRPCTGDHEATRPDGTCRVCTITCASEGATGRPYAKTDASGACICETQAHYYWPLGDAGRPRKCDVDGDGWVSRSAWNAIHGNDPAIAEVALAGCTVHDVDRIVLENEYGQSRTVHLCSDGFSTADCASGVRPLDLVEPDRNDDPTKLDLASSTDAPPISASGAGRTLRADELTAVTKACVNTTADFDDDNQYDIAQTQPVTVQDDLGRWGAFAFFVELHTSRYEPPQAMDAAGRFIITERSRCDFGATDDNGAPLPDRLAVGMPPSGGSYWTQCPRRRDPSFDASQPAPNLDFARWSCPGNGTCAVPPPPVGPYGDTDVPAAHGMCDLRGLWPTDEAHWMGMHHHSQFKCVLVGSEANPPSYEHPASEFASGGRYVLETCDASDVGADANPDFTCAFEPGTPADGRVGWATVRYDADPSSPGCIDEYWWGGMCDHTSLNQSTMRDPYPGDANDSGRLLTCSPAVYVFEPAMSTVPAPPERTLIWDQGRWE